MTGALSRLAMLVHHALITGASRGIGRAMALALAEAGVTVHAGARRMDLLEQLAKESSRIVPLHLDVADTDATVAQIQALDTQVTLDLVVANAGASPAHDATPWDWRTLKE